MTSYSGERLAPFFSIGNFAPKHDKKEGIRMPRKVLFVATTAKAHISAFHLPYLKWFHEEGFETHVAAADDMNGRSIPYCDVFHPAPFCRNPFSPRNLRAYHVLKRILAREHFGLIQEEQKARH